MTMLRKTPFGFLKIYILQTNLIGRLYNPQYKCKIKLSKFLVIFLNIYKLLENKFSNKMAANYVTITIYNYFGMCICIDATDRKCHFKQNFINIFLFTTRTV